MTMKFEYQKVMKNNPIAHIFDLNTYPINDLNNPKTKELILQTSRELNKVGCAVIRDFVSLESIARMQAEAERKMDKVFWSEDRHNPYFTKEDLTLPTDHPRRFFEKRLSGYLNSNRLDENSDLNEIFFSQILLDFLRKCLGVSPLYCWADPIGNHPYSLMKDDNYFPWHFDGNEFTVSILIQEAEQGGIFEYVPDIRSPGKENYEQVKNVLNGEKEGIHSLKLRPGDMQIFKGRFSMHRVTTTKGSKMRIIALPTYSVDPFTVNRPEHSKQVYGCALPIHYEREHYRPDDLTD